jgi:hypothetical protein
MHYRIQELCRVSGTLGKVQITLGKGFAKGHSAVISSAKTSLPSAFCWAIGKVFAECQKHSVSEEFSSRVAESTRLILVKDGFGGDLGALDRWTDEHRKDMKI